MLRISILTVILISLQIDSTVSPSTSSLSSSLSKSSSSSSDGDVNLQPRKPAASVEKVPQQEVTQIPDLSQQLSKPPTVRQLKVYLKRNRIYQNAIKVQELFSNLYKSIETLKEIIQKRNQQRKRVQQLEPLSRSNRQAHRRLSYQAEQQLAALERQLDAAISQMRIFSRQLTCMSLRRQVDYILGSQQFVNINLIREMAEKGPQSRPQQFEIFLPDTTTQRSARYYRTKAMQKGFPHPSMVPTQTEYFFDNIPQPSNDFEFNLEPTQLYLAYTRQHGFTQSGYFWTNRFNQRQLPAKSFSNSQPVSQKSQKMQIPDKGVVTSASSLGSSVDLNTGNIQNKNVIASKSSQIERSNSELPSNSVGGSHQSNSGRQRYGQRDGQRDGRRDGTRGGGEGERYQLTSMLQVGTPLLSKSQFLQVSSSKPVMTSSISIKPYLSTPPKRTVKILKLTPRHDDDDDDKPSEQKASQIQKPMTQQTGGKTQKETTSSSKSDELGRSRLPQVSLKRQQAIDITSSSSSISGLPIQSTPPTIPSLTQSSLRSHTDLQARQQSNSQRPQQSKGQHSLKSRSQSGASDQTQQSQSNTSLKRIQQRIRQSRSRVNVMKENQAFPESKPHSSSSSSSSKGSKQYHSLSSGSSSTGKSSSSSSSRPSQSRKSSSSSVQSFESFRTAKSSVSIAARGGK